MEPVAVGEVLVVVTWADVRLAEQDRVPTVPLEHVAELPQVLEVRRARRTSAQRLLEHERDSVDTEARHAEAEPIADDPLDLLADARVIRVQVGLEVEEAVEVPLAYVLRVRPRRLLDTREHDSRSRVTRPLLRPHVPVAVRRVPAAAGVEEPR